MKFLLMIKRVLITIFFLDSCNSHEWSQNMKYLDCLEIYDGYRSVFSDVGKEKQKALVSYAINNGILQISVQENRIAEVKNVELNLFIDIFKLICVEGKLKRGDIFQYVQNIKNDLMLFEVIKDFFRKFCQMTNEYSKFQGLYIDLCNENFSKAQIEARQDNIFRILRESFLNYIKFSDSLSFSKSFLYKTKLSARDCKKMSGYELNLLETTNNSGKSEEKHHEEYDKIADVKCRLFLNVENDSREDSMLLEEYSNSNFCKLDPLIAGCFEMAKFVESEINLGSIAKDAKIKDKLRKVNHIYISQINREQIEESGHLFKNLEISVVRNVSRDSFSISSENSLRYSLAPFSERKIGCIKRQDISVNYNNISHLNNEENNTSSFEVREHVVENNDNIRNIEQDLNSSEEFSVEFSSDLNYKGYNLINNSRKNEVDPQKQSYNRSERMKKLITFKTQNDSVPESETYYEIENCNETNLYNFLVVPISKEENKQGKMQVLNNIEKNRETNISKKKSFSKLKKKCEICIFSQKKLIATGNPVKIIPVFKP